MKSRIICLFLVFCLIFTLFPQMAFANSDTMVRVTFTCNTASASVRVYSGEHELVPEADGSFMLPYGDYTYTATADNYQALTDQPFRVSANDGPMIEIEPVLSLISQDTHTIIGGQPNSGTIIAMSMPENTYSESMGTTTDNTDGFVVSRQEAYPTTHDSSSEDSMTVTNPNNDTEPQKSTIQAMNFPDQYNKGQDEGNSRLWHIDILSSAGGRVQAEYITTEGLAGYELYEALRGAQVGLRIIPDSDYELDSIVVTNNTDNSIVSQDETVFTMPDAPVTVYILFKQTIKKVENVQDVPSNGYRISKTDALHGRFDVLLDGAYPTAAAMPGSRIVVVAYPDAGYYVDRIEAEGNGVTVQIDDEFIMPYADVIVRVNFSYGAEIPNGIEINESNFPDSNFRKGIADYFDNSPKDGYLNKAEIAAVREINCQNFGVIGSYQGVEYFSSLEKLNGNGAGTELDLRYNSALREISGFQGCTSLQTVYLPEGLQRIADSCFESCSSLTNINLPYSLIDIGSGAFCDCDLRRVSVPAGVGIIRMDVFSGNRNLTEVVLPDTLNIIDGNAFNNTGIKHINLPASLLRLGSSAENGVFYPVFENCPLVSVTLPEGLRSLGSSVFYNCKSLTEVILPESLLTIGSFAFHGCSSLQTIQLPSNLQVIEKCAFEGCTSLSSILLQPSITKIENDIIWPSSIHAFKNCHPEFIAYVYPGSYALGYCQKNNIPNVILGEFSVKAELATDVSQSVFHSYMARAEVNGGAAPYSYRFTIYKNGVDTITTEWIDHIAPEYIYEFIPTDIASYSFTVTVKDRLGNTITASSIELPAGEAPAVDLEANAKSHFYHSMIKIFEGAKAPSQIEGVAYYQSLPEGSNLYAAFLNSLTNLGNPVSAVSGFAKYATESDETEYYVKKAIKIAATGDTWTLIKFDDLPDVIKDISVISNISFEEYIDIVTNWLIQLTGRSRSDVDIHSYKVLRADVRDAFDGPDDSPIQGFDRLTIMGFSDDQAKKICKAFDAFKLFKKVLDIAKTAASVYNSAADVYNQMALVQSLDTQLLLNVAKGYRDRGISEGEREAGKTLVKIASSSPQERALMIWEGKAASLGLGAIASSIDHSLSTPPNGTALAVLDGITYTTDKLFGTDSVTDAFVDLSYSEEMVQNTWLDFTTKRIAFAANPNEENFAAAYYSFVSYYKSAALSEKAFSKLVDEGSQTLMGNGFNVAFGKDMLISAERASQNAEKLETIAENMRTLYGKWVSEGSNAFTELYDIIMNLETPYSKS